MVEHFIGANGWVYPAAETTALIGLSEGAASLPAASVEAWTMRIVERSALLGGYSVFFLQAIAPSHFSVCPEFFPLSVGYPENCPATRLLEASRQAGVGQRVVDLSAVLRSGPVGVEWAPVAGFGWADVTGEAVGRSLLQALAGIGALKGMTERSAEAVAQTAMVADSNNVWQACRDVSGDNEPVPEIGARIAYGCRPPTAEDGAIVIFDDGFLFANRISLLAVLALCFCEVHFVCSHDMDFSYLARCGATTVIASVAIHGLATVPTDRWHIDIAEWHFNERRQEA